MHNLYRAHLLLILLAVAMISQAESAEIAGITSGGTFKLSAKCSSKCLDVAGWSTADGGNVLQWTDNGDAAQNQIWRVDHIENGYYRLTSVWSSKVLEVVSGSLDDGGNVQQNADLGTDNQRWKIVDCGGGWFKLVAKVTSKCLDVNGAASWDGANVQQWIDNSTDAQRWAFTPTGAGQLSGAVVTPGEYLVTAKHSSKVLGIENASTDDAATMSQQDFDGTASSQRWNITNLDGGFLQLNSKLSGKMLDVYGASTDNGAAIIQWPSNGGDNQKWFASQSEGDWFHVSAKHSGKRLDISGVSMTAGAPAIQWEANTGDNQKWKFTQCYSFALSSTPVTATVGFGDYVTVNPSVTGTVYPYESCGTATIAPFTVTNGTSFILPTDAPGYFTYIARDSSGNELGRVVLTVIKTNLSSKFIVDQYGYTRQVSVTVEPAGANIRFASSDPSLLSVGVPTNTNNVSTFPMKAKAAGEVYLVAQIDGPLGKATISRTAVHGFTLETNATGTIVITEIYPDDTAKAEGILTLSPHINDLTIKMTTFVSGVTFDDSTTYKQISTNDFIQSGDSPSSTYIYYLLQAPSTSAHLCHTFTAYQDEVQVSRGW